MSLKHAIPVQKELKSLNTMALPCVATQFFVLENDEQLEAFFQQNHESYLLIGGGSNLILPPVMDRPVVSLNYSGIDIVKCSNQRVQVRVGASENWDGLVAWSVQNGYRGLENLSLIPGSVGAAPVQNIGAYGVELSDVLLSLTAYDRQLERFVELDKNDCQFDYRDSVFKRQAGRFVITYVTLELSLDRPFSLGYGALQSLRDRTDLSLAEVRQFVIETRESKLPDPLSIPNTGSFFKNPVVSKATHSALLKKYPSLIAYSVDNEHMKLAAGWLIEHAGLKKHCVGGAQVHEQQALVLINNGDASQQDVLNLAAFIQREIQKRYGVELEIEPVVIR